MTFSVAISLLSEVAGLNQTIHQRYLNLYGQSEFVSSAVVAALGFGKYNLALEWLENGRCLVWSQLNQLKAQVNSLKIQHPILATQLIQAARALEIYGNCSVSFLKPSIQTISKTISQQKAIQKLTYFAAGYNNILAKNSTASKFSRIS